MKSLEVKSLEMKIAFHTAKLLLLINGLASAEP